MEKKRRGGLYIVTGIVALLLGTLLYLFLSTQNIRKRIPGYPEKEEVSQMVKEQIHGAYMKARLKPSPDNIGNLGMIFHSNAFYERASRCYQLAIEKSKSEWIWNYYLGYLNMELGMTTNAVENLNRVVELNPNADLAWYYLGVAYESQRNSDLAEKAFIKVSAKKDMPALEDSQRVDHVPLNNYAMFQLAKLYFDTEQPERAERTLIELLQQNDGFGPAFRLLGTIYRMKGEKKQGDEYTVRANDLFPFTPPVDMLIDKLSLISRSELYLMKKIDEAKFAGYYNWALTLADQGLTYLPDNGNMISKAIKLYLAENKVNEAVGLMEKHLDYFREDYSELSTVGQLFYQKKLYAEAKEYYSFALKENPGDIGVIEHLALCLWRTEDQALAENILVGAADDNLDDPGNLAEIILVFIQIQCTDQANHYIGILRQLNTKVAKVQKLFGRLAERNGNTSVALSFYESSFMKDPDDPETIHYLGELLGQLGLWGKYVNFYKEVMVLEPNEPEYLEKMSTFLILCPDKSFRDIDEGIKYSIRAFSHKNSPPAVVISSGKNLAIGLAMKGDIQNSLKIIERTINSGLKSGVGDDTIEDLQQLKRTIEES